MVTFAELLSKYMNRTGVNQNGLADKSGVKRQTIFYWLEGKVTHPIRKNVEACAKVLRLSDKERQEFLAAAGYSDSNLQIVTTDIPEHESIENTQGQKEQKDDLINNVNPDSRDKVLARQDLSEMADIPVFYGRTKELERLTQWIVTDKCRLVAILGIGGIGKTALATNLVKHIQQEFQYVIWTSLREAPSVEEILGEVIKFLSNYQAVDGQARFGHKIKQLIKYLDQSRCLLVLDNAEAILQEGTHVGQYREGYEGYGKLIKCVAESRHQSCLVVTSREKPVEVDLLDSEVLPVRLLSLGGLQSGVQDIFKDKGLSPSEPELAKLTEWYQGNPLILTIVAARIKAIYHGDFSEFFWQEKPAFGHINKVLDEQYERLSDLERQIMYWLAINREPVSIATLRDDIFSSALSQQVPDALESLLRRSLIHKTGGGHFMLQNVVMEYTTDRLLAEVATETERINLLSFNKPALIKATAKDYVRETQIRLILNAVKNRLADMGQVRVENRLK
jgi:transcriptional regulator with XRE-family HTH domain